MIRDDIQAAQITAMKAGDKPRTATIRLIVAAIKNRDIEARTGKAPADDDTLVVEVLQKMVKQRRESIDLYVKGGRPELAEIEASEITVIEDFLPTQLSEEETTAAIEAIKAEIGAESVKDMGKVMAQVRSVLAGRADMAAVSAQVKARLAR